MLIYLNDQFVTKEEAHISALDLSVLRGYGVMDYLRTYGGHPFHLRAHIERFIASAREVGLTVPKTVQEMEAIVEELIAKTHFEETSIKLVLTGGISEDQFLPKGPPTFFAVAYSFTPFPERYFDEGIKVITECYQRPFPTAKSIQYLPAIMGMQKAQAQGAVDVLFYNEKELLLETGIANFFALKGGKLITPKEGILKGITREVILDLFPVEERDIHKEETPTFEGAFLTSSNKEVMPVIQIDDLLINKGTVPSTIRNVMKTFSKEAKKTLLNWSEV
ncbi:aminotransferase class IV [Candidatus Neptunochlamydia vexilliferae]|nr:aminotransferase class IV [Candidatus Neptunochlamydia vexilliferae]